MIMLHDGVVEDHVAELIASEIKKVHWRYEYHSRGKGKNAHPSTHWHRLCGKSGEQIIANGGAAVLLSMENSFLMLVTV